MEYPECEKLADFGTEQAIIMEFCEFLEEKNYCIGVYADEIYPCPKSPLSLFYEMYGINPTTLERERRQILAEAQKLVEEDKSIKRP